MANNRNSRGSSHNSLNARETLQVIKNPRLSQYSDDLFSLLKANEPQKSWEELVNDLEHEFTIKNGEGLLSKLTANGNQISFWLLADEEFSLQELENLKLADNPFLADTDPLKLGLENVLVNFIKQQFISHLPRALKSAFSSRVRYYTTSLPELLSAIKNFPDQLNDLEQKREFTTFVSQFRITFHELKTAFETSAPPIVLDELNTKEFKDWTESQQKTFDTLFTKTVLERLRGRVQMMKNLTKSTAELFSKPLFPSSIISKKYPIDYEELYQKAQTDYPDIAQQIADLEDQIAQGGDVDALWREIEACYWKIYLEELKLKDNQLAEILQLLYDHQFDYSVLDQNPALRSAFFDILVETKVEQMEQDHVLELFGGDAETVKNFLKELVDFSKDTLTINGNTFKIQRQIIWGGNLSLLSLGEISKGDELPLKITLSDINSAGLSPENREFFDRLFLSNAEGEATPWTYDIIELQGNKLGKLLALLMMWGSSLVDTIDTESESAKKWAKFQEDIQKQYEITKNTRKLHEKSWWDEHKEWEDTEKKEKTPEERNASFLESWNSIRGEKSETPDGGFAPWAILYFSLASMPSEVPPYGEESHQWLKLKITEVDWQNGTLKARPYWTELKLWPGLEGKQFDFHFENFEEQFINNEKFSDKPFKMLPWTYDFKTTYDKMLLSWICSESLFWDAKFDDGKLKLTELTAEGKELTEEVKYFGNNAQDPDKAVLYETKRNPDHTVTIKSTNFLDKNKEAKHHEKRMSYPDFLIFLQEKKLTPKTETIAKREKQKIDDIHSHKHRKWKWVSIHSLVFSVKNIWKKINEGIDKYQKNQDEACLDWLTSDVGIYNLLNKGLWWIAPSLSDTFTSLHDEAISGKEKKNWSAIEERIKLFKGVEFPDIFSSGKDPASGERLRQLDACLGKWKTLKDILISGTCIINDDTLRPIVAAAMIANLKQGKGLYRWMSEYDNQGLWVKTLLGPEHYARYMQHRRACQAEIDSGAPDADQLRDLLVKSEVNYIVRNIQNAHGKDKYFGSVNDSNSQILKKIYSNEFASQLNTAAEEITGQSAVEGAYGKYKKLNTFNVAEEEFKKCIKSSRIESWLGALKRMGELAKKPDQLSTLTAAMSYVTMSGILNRYAGKETMTRFDGMARSLMLPTAFFADKPYHQHYAWHVLDQVPVEPRFSEEMKNKKGEKDVSLTEAMFSKDSAKVPYSDFLTKMMDWREKNATAINDYFSSLKIEDHGWDQILSKVKEVLWEKNPDNLDMSWKSNPRITGYFAINATPATIEQNKDYNKSWFAGKDEDERNAKAIFWKDLKKKLEDKEKDPNTKPDFFLRQFKTWFARDGFADMNDPENVSMLRTIREVNNRIGTDLKFHDHDQNLDIKCSERYSKDDVEQLIWYLFKGKILRQGSCQPPKEFDDVLNFFVKYFTAHLNEISSESMLKSVFWQGATTAEGSKAEKLIPWEEYEKYIGKEDNFLNSQEDFDPDTTGTLTPEEQKKQIKLWKKRYYRSDAFINKRLVEMEKQLKRINIAGLKKLTTKWSSENITLQSGSIR